MKQITVNRADLLYLRNNKVSKNKLPEILVQRAAKQDQQTGPRQSPTLPTKLKSVRAPVASSSQDLNEQYYPADYANNGNVPQYETRTSGPGSVERSSPVSPSAKMLDYAKYLDGQISRRPSKQHKARFST